MTQSFESRPNCNSVFVICICVGVLGSWVGVSHAKAGDKVEQRRILQDKQIGSYRWIMTAPSGVNFTLAQRIPDQTRSFYIGRGFPAEAANKYGISCVFQTIVHNDSKNKLVTLDLADWRVVTDGHERPLKLTAQWLKEWEAMGVSKSARIAFQWSQLPTIQEHRPGDWFQGMIAVGLPPQSNFGLKIVWREDGTRHQAVMTDLVCPKDRTLIK